MAQRRIIMFPKTKIQQGKYQKFSLVLLIECICHGIKTRNKFFNWRDISGQSYQWVFSINCMDCRPISILPPRYRYSTLKTELLRILSNNKQNASVKSVA